MAHGAVPHADRRDPLPALHGTQLRSDEMADELGRHRRGPRVSGGGIATSIDATLFSPRNGFSIVESFAAAMSR
jgi:hypothetical protein